MKFVFLYVLCTKIALARDIEIKVLLKMFTFYSLINFISLSNLYFRAYSLNIIMFIICACNSLGLFISKCFGTETTGLGKNP